MSFQSILSGKKGESTSVIAGIKQEAEDKLISLRNGGKNFEGGLFTESARGQLEKNGPMHDNVVSVSEAVGSLIDRLYREDSSSVRRARSAAGTIAAVIGADPASFFSESYKASFAAKPNSVIINSGVADPAVRDLALMTESFDRSEMAAMQQYSVAYNMDAGFGSEFGETLYPTIVQDPLQAGFSMSVVVNIVQNAITRETSGALADWQRRNILRGYRDHTVMSKHKNDVIPVYRPEAAANFADSAVIPAYDITVDGRDIHTAPLKFGAEFDLMAISQRAEQLAQGARNQLTSLDPAISLKNVYVKIGNDVIRLNASLVASSQFVAIPQTVDRTVALNMSGVGLNFSASTKTIGQTALTGALADIATSKLTVNLNLRVSGSVHLETGKTELNMTGLRVASIYNEDGVEVPRASKGALVTAIEAAAGVGYDLTAYVVNSELAERGDLIGYIQFNQSYVVPRRSPITAQRVTAETDSAGEALDLKALLEATKVRLGNEAVTSLLKDFDNLHEIAQNYRTSPTNINPQALGMGRYGVIPTSRKETISLKDRIDSLKSADRMEDLQAVIVNIVRDAAYRLWRDSELQVALDAKYNGAVRRPTVIVATDPVLAEYLMVTGDTRTLGNEFNLRVVSTIDERFDNKLFITFGVFSEDTNSVPNELHWGNLFWAPEAVVTIPARSAGNTVAKEIIVQPRYLFVNHLPIGAMYDIDPTGVEEIVTKKVALYNKPL